MQPRLLPILAVLVLSAVAARAQDFYVDLEGGSPTPSPAYGAAYGVPGHWNSIPGNDGFYPLLDSSGAAGPVQAEIIECGAGEGCLDCFPTPPGCASLGGDDAALLADWWSSQCLAAPPHIFIRNLAAGKYLVFVIGYNACGPQLVVQVGVNGTTVLSGGSAFTGTWEDFPVGVHALDIAAGGTLHLVVLNTSSGGLAGFQIVRLGDDATPYCSGYLGGCPCGAGAPDSGCPTSFDAQGASLAGSGSALVGADTLVLSASGVSNSVVTFFQGTALVNNGQGAAFGDGLRCAGGSTIRIASKLAAGGNVVYPEAGETAISVRGAVPPAGGFRTYQVWYRNAAAYCTSATFNLTNGVALVWR